MIKVSEFNDEEIQDVFEMNDGLSEMFGSFLIQLEGNTEMTREPTEEDGDFKEENIAFMWTDKACRLIHEEKKRLIEIGKKYFPNDDIEVESTMFKEF